MIIPKTDPILVEFELTHGKYTPGTNSQTDATYQGFRDGYRNLNPCLYTNRHNRKFYKQGRTPGTNARQKHEKLITKLIQLGRENPEDFEEKERKDLLWELFGQYQVNRKSLPQEVLEAIETQ